MPCLRFKSGNVVINLKNQQQPHLIKIPRFTTKTFSLTDTDIFNAFIILWNYLSKDFR